MRDDTIRRSAQSRTPKDRLFVSRCVLASALCPSLLPVFLLPLQFLL